PADIGIVRVRKNEMTLSDAVAESRWTRRLAFLVASCHPIVDLESSGESLRLGQAKRERVDLAEISLGRLLRSGIHSPLTPDVVRRQSKSDDCQASECVLRCRHNHIHDQHGGSHNEEQRSPRVTRHEVAPGQFREFTAVSEKAGGAQSVKNPGYKHGVANQLLEGSHAGK